MGGFQRFRSERPLSPNFTDSRPPWAAVLRSFVERMRSRTRWAKCLLRCPFRVNRVNRISVHATPKINTSRVVSRRTCGALSESSHALLKRLTAPRPLPTLAYVDAFFRAIKTRPADVPDAVVRCLQFGHVRALFVAALANHRRLFFNFRHRYRSRPLSCRSSRQFNRKSPACSAPKPRVLKIPRRFARII